MILRYNNITKILTVPYTINNELKDIPEDIKVLIFEEQLYKCLSVFNQKVDNLPPKLMQIKFGNNFNQRVDNLPNNLIHLTFSEKFNQGVDNSLFN